MGIETFHAEHEETLELLRRVEILLGTAERGGDEERAAGLVELRALERPLGEITDHCRAEEAELHRYLRPHLDQADESRLHAEHELLARKLSDFRQELRFATILHTSELCAQGRQLIDLLRRHIEFEETLFERAGARTSEELKLWSDAT